MHPFAGALAFAAALLLSSAAHTAQDPISNGDTLVHLRLLDAQRRPLPAGTEVYADVKWIPNAPLEYVFVDNSARWLLFRTTVGEDGAASLRILRPLFIENIDHYLIAHSSGLDASGIYGIAHWPAPASTESPLELVMRSQEVLCRGRLLDDLGRLVLFEEVDLHVHDPRPYERRTAQLLLWEGYRARGDGYEMVGFPQHGEWVLTAHHGHRGPVSKPCQLEIGRESLDLVLPASGLVQIRTRLPEHFPTYALEAVYRHTPSGEVARWPIDADTSRHRLLVGEHALRLELCGGKRLVELGKVNVPHAQQIELPVELPSSLRAFRIAVTTEEGAPLPVAHARVEGCATWGFSSDRSCGGLWIATALEHVDLAIESEGYEPLVLDAVQGEIAVRLKRLER